MLVKCVNRYFIFIMIYRVCIICAAWGEGERFDTSIGVIILVAEIRKSLAGAVFMAALTGNACAAVISCPSVSDIKQVPGEYGGFAYTATLPNGQQWTGENPMADEADLGRVVFQEAYIVNAKNFVACDYVGKKASGMRMALKTASPIRPVGAAWKWQKQADGTLLPHCVGPNPAQCTFE